MGFSKLPDDVLFRLDIVKIRKDDEEGVEIRTAGQAESPILGFLIVKMIGNWLSQWGMNMLVACGKAAEPTYSVAQCGSDDNPTYMRDGKFVEKDTLEDLK